MSRVKITDLPDHSVSAKDPHHGKANTWWWDGCFLYHQTGPATKLDKVTSISFTEDRVHTIAKLMKKHKEAQ